MENSLSIWTVISQSGPVVMGVLLILVFFSIFSWAIVLKKWRFFKAVSKENKKFLKFFHHSHSFEDISEVALGLKLSPLSTQYYYGYKEIQQMRQKVIKDKDRSDVNTRLKKHFEKYGLDSLTRSLKRGREEASITLSNLLGYLASISSVAPFIGLFGTVWGIINSFTGLAEGGGSIEAVAPGIAEALVATAVGLAAAIPASWFYNIFYTRLSHVDSEMEAFEQEFLNLVERVFLFSTEEESSGVVES